MKTTLLLLLLTGLVLPTLPAQESPLSWPAEWVVFGPMEQRQPLVDPAELKSVPQRIVLPDTDHLPGKEFAAQKVKATPGQPVNLAPILGSKVGATAYVFVELESTVEQQVTLGLGADYWLLAWLNGEPIVEENERAYSSSPVGILGHQLSLRLRPGRNVLALRFSRGANSALLALGDESHFAQEHERLRELRAKRTLNTLPDTLADRLLFPVEEQATATAGWNIDLILPDADLSTGALVGLIPMPQRQVWLDTPPNTRAALRDTLERRFEEPVTIRLSKSRYPFEDRHLDAIVWTTPPEGEPPSGVLEVRLLDADGQVLAQHEIAELSPTGWFFSLGFPERLAGRSGVLEVIWRDGTREIGRARAPFEVREPESLQSAGRIPIRLLNAPGAVIQNAPMTVGVPFPRGALADAGQVRLLDERGEEIPLQARVSARWSRFGSVKWLLCDFTADLDGTPREVFLEYGRDVLRHPVAPIAVTTNTGRVPVIEAGRLRFDSQGLAYDFTGRGDHRAVLDAAALSGAFVRHADGGLYAVPLDAPWEVEEHGSEKAVLRRTGWYRLVPDQDSGAGVSTPDGAAVSLPQTFCQYVTRIVLHRDSPVLRIFHTWIYTGDGNRDRIANMGWKFPAPRAREPHGLLARLRDRFNQSGSPAPGPQPLGFLVSFDSDEWVDGRYLVQFDHSHFLIDGGPEREGRTPGVLGMAVPDSRVFFGAKDFWQNFPSELEFDATGFTFYNWPARNPPASFERPVTPKTAFLHRFAHEGEVLDFRLPDEYADGPIWEAACSREGHWARGRPETANAQGIARTEEMFLFLADPDETREAAAAVLRGLNDESLRAVVEPAWLAASGVFGNIHPRDLEKYAGDEWIYEQVVRAPARWNERLGFYGMWIYGDVPAWSIDLENRTVDLYRAIRKNHHGWPVGWLPFARSGDPQLLKFAEAATRQMTDANFCHYADAAVDATVGPTHFRAQGWWDRSLLPWAAHSGPHARSYTVDSDYLWDAYHLTGYARARDVALLFGEATKNDHLAPTGPRATSSMLHSYLDMYQATWDPWFLDAAHNLARLHQRLVPHEQELERFTHESPGHFWRPADEAFHRFTGDDDYRLLALNHSIGWSSPRSYGFGGLWSRLSVPYIRQAVYAWELTGDPWFLDRADAYLDWARRGVQDGETEHLRGSLTQGGSARGIFTGYYIRQFPHALAAFEQAGYRPQTYPNPFFLSGAAVPDSDPGEFHFQLPEILLRKDDKQAFSLSLLALDSVENQAYDYALAGPDDWQLSGSWPLDARPRTVDVGADAPGGIYRVVLSGGVPLPGGTDDRARVLRRHGRILVPLAEPGIPEVMVFPHSEKGTRVASGGPEIQYFFQVPDGIDEFWIEFLEGGRISVWNPESERVWDHSGTHPGRVSIPVPAGQGGRVWGASGGAFLIDPRIPPYFSANRSKWFHPPTP